MGMDGEHGQRHSFVVTIWREDAPSEHPTQGWRGHITHVQSGERRYLFTLQEIVSFIGAHLGSFDTWVEHKGLLTRWSSLTDRIRAASPTRRAAVNKKQTRRHGS